MATQQFNKARLVKSLEDRLRQIDADAAAADDKYQKKLAAWKETQPAAFAKAVAAYNPEKGNWHYNDWTPPSKPSRPRHENREAVKAALQQLSLIDGDQVSIPHALRDVFGLLS